MASPVKLYIYDLSNGLARQLSLQLTGRQIDGIWHTSIVVFGKEVFYGQGISTTRPGQSHHGQPLQIIEMGETAIDEDTFNEYLQEMAEMYTADKYHLLDFNCNSFTNDVIGFMTGGSIPSWIKDLPADFLSTPFGAALRPTIDNMFRRPTPGAVNQPPQVPPSAATSLLQSVARQAAQPSQAGSPSYLPTPVATPSPSLPASQSTVGSIQVCSNVQHFNNLLSTHKTVVAFFTSQTCPPCRMIEPEFEKLAWNKGSSGVGFVKIDIGSMMGGGQVASVYGVRATPTFIFFLDGKKVHELKGADAGELRTQTDLLIYQAFPPHQHASLPLRATRSVSLDPILFTQVPALDTVFSKLVSLIDAAPSSPNKEKAKSLLSTAVIPFLKTRFDNKNGSVKLVDANRDLVKNIGDKWHEATAELILILPTKDLFPLIDLWRIGLLDKSVAAWCVGKAATSSASPPLLLIAHISRLMHGDAPPPKAVLLTTLRMASNAFANEALARSLLMNSARDGLTALLVPTLLHSDAGVRTAAASLTFNVAAHYQKPRMDALRSGRHYATDEGTLEERGDGDWEVEMISAVVEAIKVETGNEDVVHRLTAALAFFVHLSPFIDTQIKPMLEVLEAQDVLKAKLSGGEGGCGENGVSQKTVRGLVEEVSAHLCAY